MTDLDQEQRKRITGVLEYIAANLEQKLSLEQLAKQSSYSPSHFHRMFTEIVGETPADYVKRLRLEQSAHLLIYEPNMAVTDIALQCGFSSLSYFTYAFTEYFQQSPKAWREGGYLEKFSTPYLTGFQWIDPAKVRIAAFPACSVIFTQRFGSYSHELVNTWEKVYRWAAARELVNQDTIMMGIPHNNPYITPEDQCRYDCCMTVPAGLPMHSGVEQSVFQGGKHAVYEFEEPIGYDQRQLLIHCYSELYSYWLPRSGYRYVGIPVERVQINSKPGTLDIDCRITGIALAIEPK